MDSLLYSFVLFSQGLLDSPCSQIYCWNFWWKLSVRLCFQILILKAMNSVDRIAIDPDDYIFAREFPQPTLSDIKGNLFLCPLCQNAVLYASSQRYLHCLWRHACTISGNGKVLIFWYWSIQLLKIYLLCNCTCQNYTLARLASCSLSSLWMWMSDHQNETWKLCQDPFRHWSSRPQAFLLSTPHEKPFVVYWSWDL